MKRNNKFSASANRVICLPFDQKTYPKIVNDPEKFRAQVDEFFNLYPELFPRRIINGYQLKETRY